MPLKLNEYLRPKVTYLLINNIFSIGIETATKNNPYNLNLLTINMTKLRCAIASKIIDLLKIVKSLLTLRSKR
jgi:hypothetical protein